MRILSMTATFGKLENQTLTLKPGLNILHAPNEWGKSTWCAFLTVMLYGIDTGARSKKGVLADKERYAPWSGTPMSGRMEIDWEGRRITIERKAKGRTPMGDFSAYETDTGLPVGELSASNCGEKLLGVERSVYQRAGFIQLSDLPVTQDESLRRRLNALVTTGDENSAGDDLAQKLKDLKNKCRFNNKGLLPQAEAQKAELVQKIGEYKTLESQADALRARQKALESYIAQLENHRVALDYAAAESALQRVAAAERVCDAAAVSLCGAEAATTGLPPREEADAQLQCARKLLEQQSALQLDAAALPQAPLPPQTPLRYQNVAPETATSEALKDLDAILALNSKKQKNSLILGIYAGISVLLLLTLSIPQVRALAWLVGAAIALGGITAAAVCILRTRKICNEIERIYDLHPGQNTGLWLPEAEQYQKAYAAYTTQLQAVQNQLDAWKSRKAAFDRELAAFTQGKSLLQIQESCLLAIAKQDTLLEAQREYARRSEQLEMLRAVAKPAPKPQFPDTLTDSREQTATALGNSDYELRTLHTQLGSCQGKMEQLGDPEVLKNQLDTVNARIRHLELNHKALEIAQQTLSDASASLQRRFAPRISSQAQDIFSRLTGGRYSRLSLAEDLSIQAGAETETTLRPALWRSEGTIDQLYLALRLAVARELTPQAPLVLDDALARFDDTRLTAALEILKEEAEHRQVILFSCQSREKNSLPLLPNSPSHKTSFVTAPS